MSVQNRLIDINALVEWANIALARTDEHATQEFKSGIFTLTSKILVDVGCYQGFNYLYWDTIGYKEWKEAGRPEGPEKDQYIYGSLNNRNEYNRFFYKPYKN